MSDDDFSLGELDHTEESVWPPEERRVVTTAFDLSVETLVRQWTDGELVVPAIQRHYEWDNGRASRLIESLLMNIPLPVLYFQEREDARYEIIDGHQRIRSVSRFLNNEFGMTRLNVLGQYSRQRFHELPAKEQRYLKTRVMRAIIITKESASSMKVEIFGRLNTGGLALNAQEVRHAMYNGAFTEMLESLETFDLFRKIMGTPKPRARMVDRELVLRFLALRGQLNNYRAPLLRFLNDFSERHQSVSQDTRSAFESTFEAAVTKVFGVYGESAFRVIDSSGKSVERAVNRALFDAQMLVFDLVPEIPVDSTNIIAATAELFENQTFTDAIRRATGNRARLMDRVRILWEAMERSGVALEALPSVD
ncbi:MAG: DUF262 domain-containing protein [Actinobacteria bacterium]|nr:DUF262 domain-containing protein [Actinomycetota bacterium]